jgi:hypothetical protein
MYTRPADGEPCATNISFVLSLIPTAESTMARISGNAEAAMGPKTALDKIAF